MCCYGGEVEETPSPNPTVEDIDLPLAKLPAFQGDWGGHGPHPLTVYHILPLFLWQ